MGVLDLMFGVPVENFLAETWPHQPRHAEGSAARFADIAEDPALRSIPAFLREHRGHACVRGSTWSELAWIDDAPERFERGELLDLGGVAQRVPAVQAWIELLAEELALNFGAHLGTCRGYVGRAGTGSGKHFDHRDVFLVQLHGRVRWWLAPNDALPAPLATHVAGMPIHASNREGDLAVLDAKALPAGATAIELEPGGVLFVPRGYWQATELLDDALTLAFSFRVPPWLDLVVHALVAWLASDLPWRGIVDGDPSPELVRAMDRAIELLGGIDLPRRS